MRKKIKKPKPKIIPEKNRCDCGKKVTDHHWLCNDCHAKKQRHDFWRQRMKQVRASQRANKLKGKKINEEQNNEKA